MEKIVSWKDYLNSPERLVSEIEDLKKEIGEDFLEKVLKNLKEFEEEVIIAIENQT